MQLKKGTVITLLTSYCEGDNEKCTDRLPCIECIKMCNTFELKNTVRVAYKGEVLKK